MSRYFDGSQAIITFSNPSTPTAYTWSMWLFGAATPATTSTTQPLVIGTTSGSFGFSWNHSSSTFKQAAFHKDSGGTTRAAAVNGTLSASVWYHIAATWDGSTFSCWKYGVDQNDAFPTSVASITGSSSLGADLNTNWWTGYIGEFAYWSRALKANELLALGRGVLARQIPASLQIYLPLWGLSSPEPDLSGNANNGTVTGATAGGNPPVTLYTRKSIIGIDQSVTATGNRPLQPFIFRRRFEPAFFE